ncbi:MAG TPA: sigma-54-dependent Fis family transcriptional regulator [Syntrophaceae bacterium]|nr:sigma-54-dependent Fis family transcriptional regulator [Syntrophaceae bacterium]
MDTVLVVDDEKNYLLVLDALLSEEGYEVITAESGMEALQILKEAELDLVVTDLKMPKMNGIELLEHIKESNPDLPVIMMTAYGTIDTAIEAMKKGAYDYITKPFQNEELKLNIRKAIDAYHLLRENRQLNQALRRRFRFDNIVGKSKPMLKIFELIEKVAATKAAVLITGETGTGKELIAKAIHYNSPRRDKPFISINCAALTETLLESELFGHEKGSFTGAISTKKGRFEIAHGGSLFLDEVGETSPSLQVKLLRTLQEMEFERVGGTKTLKVDVRVIAASNKDLKKEVQEGNFRKDLYYRLNVVHIQIPPLRDRPDDIPLLVSHFIDKFSKEMGKSHITISPEAMRSIYNRKWPGNVRELEHIIERAVILCSGNVIQISDLPEEPREAGQIEPDWGKLITLPTNLPQSLEAIEAKLIERALIQSNYVQARAAALLGITKSLLQYKMNKYNLSIPKA